MPSLLTTPNPAEMINQNPSAAKEILIHEGQLDDTSSAWVNLGNPVCAVGYPKLFIYAYGNGVFKVRTVQGYYRRDTGAWKTMQENDSLDVEANTMQPAKMVDNGAVFVQLQYYCAADVTSAFVLLNGRAVS